MPTFVTYNIAEKCFLARIQRKGFKPHEYFTIKEYGTADLARLAAENWVKNQLELAPPPTPNKGRVTNRNNSGVVGVRLADATRRRNGNVYPDWRWVANWPGCENPGGTGWSVKHYGDDRAFVCAYLARRNETLDRVFVEDEYMRIFSSSEYRDILAFKMQRPP